MDLLLRKILILVTIINLAGCSIAREKDKDNHVENNKNLSNYIDPNDFDGDNILNEVDPGPYMANFPILTFSLIPKIDIKMNLLDGARLKEFQLEQFFEVQSDPIKEKIIIDSALSAATYFKTRDSSHLRSIFSHEPTIIITPMSEVDSILNLKRLSREGFYGFEDKSGKVFFEGEIKASGLYFKIFNIKYSLGISSKLLDELGNSRVDKLKNGQVEIELSQMRNVSNFDIFQTLIDPQDLYDIFLKETGQISLKIENFDYTLKENGKVFNYKTVKEKISKSTLALKIISPDEVITKNISLKKPMSLVNVLESNFSEKGDVEVDDTDILTFMGQQSDLGATNNLKLLKESDEGRWFVFSSRNSNSPRSKINNGDTLTLAYLKGREIYKASRKTVRYNFPNFTGDLRRPFLPLLKDDDRFTVILEGITKDDFSSFEKDFGEIGWLPQRIFKLKGKFAHIVTSPFIFEDVDDSRVRFDITLGFLQKKIDSFKETFFHKNLNSIILESDFLKQERPVSFSINSGNKKEFFASKANLEIIMHGGPRYFPVNIQSENFSTKDVYHVNILVESFL